MSSHEWETGRPSGGMYTEACRRCGVMAFPRCGDYYRVNGDAPEVTMDRLNKVELDCDDEAVKAVLRS